MRNNLIESFKNSSMQTIALVIVFFLGVLFSAYKLVMLPHDLLYYGNVPNVSLATGIFISLSFSIILTFLVGIATIASSVQTKKETIVYIEKKKNEDVLEESKLTENEDQLIDVEGFKSAVTEVDKSTFLQTSLNKMCNLIQAGQGAIYLANHMDGKRELELKYGFALAVAETAAPKFEFGEGLIGQVALSGKSVYLDEVPEGYITIVSGLGTSYPRYLLILPLKEQEKIKGVIELATFKPMVDVNRLRLEEIASFIATKLN